MPHKTHKRLNHRIKHASPIVVVDVSGGPVTGCMCQIGYDDIKGATCGIYVVVKLVSGRDNTRDSDNLCALVLELCLDPGTHIVIALCHQYFFIC